jgi:hypothetical protein
MTTRLTTRRAAWLARLTALALMIGPAFAANPYSIGQTITNPVTGATETVQNLLGDDLVLTSQGNVIVVVSAVVGQTFVDRNNPRTTLQITAVHVNPTTSLADQITVTDGGSPATVSTIELVAPRSAVVLTAPAGVNNNIVNPQVGAPGAAGGISQPGLPGKTPNPINQTINADAIHSATTAFQICIPLLGCFPITLVPHTGISESSVGGNGGAGGNASPVSGAGQGGAAGAGGDVNVTSNVPISTSGFGSGGIYAASTGGAGGPGGTGFIYIPGATGGPPAQGGAVTVTNNSNITTRDVGAPGIEVESLGGNGGNGGNSWGIVGVGGTASEGGNGGTAAVVNNGSVTTLGAIAPGIVALSIGGDGGDAGAAGGVVALGGSGNSGGNAAQVAVVNKPGAAIVTQGPFSYGVLAQSIGGGGGYAGTAGGIVAIGGSGATGGNGGAVSVSNDVGSFISTSGFDAIAVVAQSIGGGGGTGGSSGGLVALGGAGSAAGNGGDVTITSRATIVTQGAFARGLEAQSIGGGGGDGGSSGGAVSVGGTGSLGGSGGSVTVTNNGVITTSGAWAEGVLAQSIGGGGGSGGDNGGLVAIGGSGSVASIGGFVTVTNTAPITTDGNVASAIHAQSIGGGGGTGGTNGGVFFTLGGVGGGGGGANAVAVNNDQNLTTKGSDANGIFAESIGGGGGNAGSSASGSAFAGVAIGGSGGNGGSGSSVTITSSNHADGVHAGGVVPVIATQGDRAAGIFAQSVGGGGGSGGFAVQASVGYGLGASVSVGGAGGGGGNGGDVMVNGDATIQTSGGANAPGILAQSVGGGGGSGGFDVSFAGAASEAGAAAFAVGVGGKGGGGGQGGTVTLNAGGDISTTGQFSEGLIAQSVGGGGGKGGFSVTLGAAGTGGGAGAVSVGVGGHGGGGGDGGTVNVTYTGNVSTQGGESDAVIAQSVGGGGGHGGFNVSGAVAGSEAGTLGVTVGVGGTGGGGGNGGKVTASLTGNVMTSGESSSGFVVQSSGGGGGKGAFDVAGSIAATAAGGTAISVGVGGSGGSGGRGGDVSGQLTGNATTHGFGAIAVLVQSVGGAGGNGTFNVTGGITASADGSGALGVGVGGAGGGGGDAGGATAIVNSATNSDASRCGAICTSGGGADAIVVQSVGGGGGNGAFNVTGALAASESGGGALSVGVGGHGGGGGAGGPVGAQISGDVQTVGEQSGGVVLQSVGGGGGKGAINVAGAVSLSSGSDGGAIALGFGGSGGGGGSAGDITGGGVIAAAEVTGSVSTGGAGSTGVLAQSVGGGGGHGALNVAGAVDLAAESSVGVAVGVGGFGGGGGNGGKVALTRIGDTTTTGADSDGVVAQSVGGGGGHGGINVSGAVALTLNEGSSPIAVVAGLGGFGGGGGNAQDVSATVNGNVFVSGLGSNVIVQSDDGVSSYHKRTDGSNGIIAQSVGGGGGIGALNVSGGIVALPIESPTGALAVTLGVGGFGGSGGNAGAVTLAVSAAFVQSEGDNRVGVGAQSIGGGGGEGGINVAGGIALSHPLNIVVGSGGFGGGGGRGGNVTATANTDISSFGSGSMGFLAQSLGGGGGNGGINVSGGIDTKGLPVFFGLGGAGGANSTSGDVVAVQSGNVRVTGTQLAFGVVAESIAGGGGNGGFDVTGNLTTGKGLAAAIGVGGFGGTGANAGNVSLISDGQVRLDETDPAVPQAVTGPGYGILALSLGGGGGIGGFNLTGVAAPSGSPLAIGVGGFGGGGGDAGTVTVQRATNKSDGTYGLQTIGDQAPALAAQSIGGGGGNAGVNVVLEASGLTDPGTQYQVQLAVGGGGGDAGNGSTVKVTQDGLISTAGRSSPGIQAESIGGGGGNAAWNLALGVNEKAKGINVTLGGGPGEGGSAAAVTVTNNGSISTGGDDSEAISAQSIGGGGGDAALNMSKSVRSSIKVDIGIGRVGGSGGQGGDVNVTSSGPLVTGGARSDGILAQSIGGGGGKSGSISVDAHVHAQSPTMQEPVSGSASLEVGLEGGSGASAGNVTVTNSGSIFTTGDQSHDIGAQSVGGGGGIGGEATTHFFLTDNKAGLAIGGTGGTGATAGTVTVTNSAQLNTVGAGADGIYAQSIGGGGGVGGYSGVQGVNAGVYDTTKSFIATASIGGSGGTGATGNTVTVTNTGTILTQGAKSLGINAESIGGGGGDGGMIVDATLSIDTSGSSLAIGVGGLGGTGGAGGTVTVDNQQGSWIHTSGDNSSGIQARSVGGGGGDAGLIADLSIGLQSHALTTSVNVGGQGGVGNQGGTVKVTNEAGADILTEGESAYGIFAQSIGGGGGDGSSIVSVKLTQGKGSGAVPVSVNIGGAGGKGGLGGPVTVENDGRIETQGETAHGIYAQSLGGGGGNGGLVLAVNALLSGSGTGVTPTIAVGGSGGEGNDAGPVTVINHGQIVTHGNGADGIYAQSVGGGGGDAGIGVGVGAGGGFANTAVTTAISGILSAVVGGRGGAAGGQGGTVTVHQVGDITVLGDNASAVDAESLNGGGGHIALDFNGITSLPGGTALPFSPTGIAKRPELDFHIGGTDTQKSDAARVTVDYTDTFRVAGNNGAGNSVQSIGGGGGTIDENLSTLDATTAVDDRVQLQGQLGGIDGQSNRGGDVASTHTGDVVTAGANTPGVFIQSVGGGGGRANVFATSETGSLGPSSFVIGGANGTDESGGSITHTQSGAISTSGALAHGVLAQSIGGGGGALSFILEPAAVAPTASVAPTHDLRRIGIMTRSYTALPGAAAPPAAPASTAPNAPLSVTLGSAGGSGLDGGAVAVDLSGPIATGGANAAGLVVQSIGGGGGTAGVIGATALAATIGGATGASGNGGALDVTHTGNVSTAGSRAHGVILQSIGGGGGALFTNVAAPSVTVSSGGSGNGGAITFTQVGNIVTTGLEARGILAQSLGGGGGFVDGAFAGSAGGAGAGGAITLTMDGDLMTLGDRSTALLAQSAGSSGGGDIDLLLTAGHSIIGGAGGVGVAIDGGANNRFENHGKVMTLSGAQGVAITGGAGNDVISNYGTVLGNIDLGGGANSFANHAGATLYSGATLNLGAASSLLVNDGVLAPGGTGLALTTQLSGSFRQSVAGTSQFKLDLGSNTVDSLVATGTAELAGRLDLSLLNSHDVMPGNHTSALYTAAGGVTNEGLQLDAPPSAVITYQLLFPDSQTATLDYAVNFAPPALVGNRIAIGDYFNRVQLAGSSAALADTITALVSAKDLNSYSDLLTQLGPEFYTEQQAGALESGRRFSRIMQDCGTQDRGPDAAKQPDCLWARYDAPSYRRTAAQGFPSVHTDGHSYAWGIQLNRPSGWSYGIGVDFEDENSSGFDGRWSADTTIAQLGLVARRSFGPVSAGLVLEAGDSSAQVQRHLAVAGSTLAIGHRDVPFFSAVLDVKDDIGIGGLTLTPSLSLGFAELQGAGMSERQAGAQGLDLSGESESHLWVEPALDLAYFRSFPNQRFLRAYARVGAVEYLSGATTAVSAQLAGAPSGVTPMQVTSDLDHTQFIADGGFEFAPAARLTLGLYYTVQHSQIRDAGTASARISLALD